MQHQQHALLAFYMLYSFSTWLQSHEILLSEKYREIEAAPSLSRTACCFQMHTYGHEPSVALEKCLNADLYFADVSKVAFLMKSSNLEDKNKIEISRDKCAHLFARTRTRTRLVFDRLLPLRLWSLMYIYICTYIYTAINIYINIYTHIHML
jgi:hypothetical protein